MICPLLVYIASWHAGMLGVYGFCCDGMPVCFIELWIRVAWPPLFYPCHRAPLSTQPMRTRRRTREKFIQPRPVEPRPKHHEKLCAQGRTRVCTRPHKHAHKAAQGKGSAWRGSHRSFGLHAWQQHAFTCARRRMHARTLACICARLHARIRTQTRTHMHAHAHTQSRTVTCFNTFLFV